MAGRGYPEAWATLKVMPAKPMPVPLPTGAEPIQLRDRGVTAFGSGPVTGPAPASGPFGSGPVTGSIPAPTQVGGTPATRDPGGRRRAAMRWYAGGAGLVLVLGLVVILAMVLTGNSPVARSRQAAAPDTRSELARMCPPPTAGPAPEGPVPATPSGPRTVDTASGISYRAYGDPWLPWDQTWVTQGELGIVFRTGQYFVTQNLPDGDEYLASILSSSVPAATNDAMTLDLRCAGEQVTADVRQSWYPTPNTMDTIKEQQTTLGGRPAFVDEFRLHFHEEGLIATSELVVIAMVDVGRPNAAILYISIPDTHQQYDYVIDQLLASVRPT